MYLSIGAHVAFRAHVVLLKLSILDELREVREILDGRRIGRVAGVDAQPILVELLVVVADGHEEECGADPRLDAVADDVRDHLVDGQVVRGREGAADRPQRLNGAWHVSEVDEWCLEVLQQRQMISITQLLEVH